MYNKYLQQHNPDVHMMSGFLLTARDPLQLSCFFPFSLQWLIKKESKKNVLDLMLGTQHGLNFSHIYFTEYLLLLCWGRTSFNDFCPVLP